MSGVNLKPTRQAEGLYADLDAIISEPIYFKLHGKRHEIKPVTTQEFLVVSAALSNMWDMMSKKQVPPDEVIDRYTEVIQSVCDTVTRKDVEDMQQSQAVGLMQLVMDTMTGQAHTPDYNQKKKVIQDNTSRSLD
jgi:hypothetical protein